MWGMRIDVDDGKYTFVLGADSTLRIERYGELWVTLSQGPNAVLALMYEIAELRTDYALCRVCGRDQLSLACKCPNPIE